MYFNVSETTHEFIRCRWIYGTFVRAFWVCVWLLDTHMQQLYKVDHWNMFEITSFCTWDSQDFKGIPSVVRPRFDPIIGVRWLIWIPLFSRKNRSAFSLAHWHNMEQKKNCVKRLVWICCWISFESHQVGDRERHR